jgi:ParB-like chromosome segregation protein Spo0J
VTYANPFPALDKRTETELSESIKSRGVVVPVIVDQHGTIIDGHNRQRIAAEHGQDFPVHVIDVPPGAAEELAIVLNTVRRQLNPKQRAAVVKSLVAKGMTERAIAGALKVDQATVNRDKRKADANASSAVTSEKDNEMPESTPRKAKNKRQQILEDAHRRRFLQAVGVISGVAHTLSTSVNLELLKGAMTAAALRREAGRTQKDVRAILHFIQRIVK